MSFPAQSVDGPMGDPAILSTPQAIPVPIKALLTLVTVFATSLAGTWASVIVLNPNADLAIIPLAIPQLLACGWALQILIARARLGRFTSVFFVGRLYLVALGRIVAVGIAILTIGFGGLLLAYCALFPFLLVLAHPERPPGQANFVSEVVVPAAFTVFPIFLLGLFGWKKLWPTLHAWWYDDLGGCPIGADQ